MSFQGRGVAAAVAAAVLSAAGAVAPDTAAVAAQVQTRPFVPGTGSAAAEVGRIALRSSGTVVSIGFGTTRARYAGAQGNAEAAGVDLGLLELASKAPVACGAAAGSVLPPGSMPEPVKVSSGDGATAERRASAGAGTPVEIMSQYGSAKPNAAAAADVDGVRLEIAGIVTAVGGSAGSTALLTPGRERAASADSGLGSLTLAGGLVRLEGMRWSASHRTGADPLAAAGFTLGGLSVGSRALPTTDAASVREALAAANAALAPLGLALQAPQVVRTDRGSAVTPLRLSVSATPDLRRLLAAALDSVQPLRTQLLALLDPFRLSKDCGLANAVGFGYLLADLALVVLGDDGGVDLDFGGASAGTQALTYRNPLASGYGLLPPGGVAGGGPVPPGAGSPTAGMAGMAGGASLPPGGLGGGGAQAGPAPGAPADATGVRPAAVLDRGSPVAWACRSAHGGSGCARHVGVLAGWLILSLIVVLAAADRLRARRAAAPRPEATS